MEPPIRAEDIRESPLDEQLRIDYLAQLDHTAPDRASYLRVDTEHQACALALAACEAGESSAWIARVARRFLVYLVGFHTPNPANLVERLCALEGWSVTAAYEAVALVQGNRPVEIARADREHARAIAASFAPYAAIELYTATGRAVRGAMIDAATDADAELLAAIEREPDDEANRMVYADALEQRGDPRSAYVRLEARFAALEAELAARAAALDARWIELVRRRYGVELVAGGPSQVVTIRVIRQVLGVGLRDAKQIMQEAPRLLVSDQLLARAVEVRVMFGDTETRLVAG